MKISEYQRAAELTDLAPREPWTGLTQSLFGLVEKAGCLAGSVKRRLRDKRSYAAASFREDMERLAGEAVWYLASTCTHFKLDLEEVAKKNIDSNRHRWGPIKDEQNQLFAGRLDAHYPEEERLPPKISAHFVSTEGPNKVSWLSVTDVFIDGFRFGDPIDDNTRREDGYRFHDVLHLAFAAYLGWSPVVRKLLKRKRKSDPKVDKFEDGARARDTEEAVSNFIHLEARRNHYFDGAKHVDTAFLIKIRGMVADLEVGSRTLAEWEKCILAAYAVFAQLRGANGGYVDVFLDEPRLQFRKS